ncbi:MAG: hypothetical protein CMC63_11300 [Flavobacteriaceae bacterium]|nr:hypothetical protein [Flavobacteriaceae bacterium]|tara:strand:- start:1220 stop:1570 length:351 start_codon:yes stop_codon:yes gene_type:complete
MKASKISLINAITLLSMGSWGYFELESRPVTALIPVFVGLILLIINNGVKNENKIIAHIAVLITLIILFGLIKPLLGTIERENTFGIIRVSLMIITSLWAMIGFVKSFISARRANK